MITLINGSQKVVEINSSIFLKMLSNSVIIFINVDLPLPEGPYNNTTSPLFILIFSSDLRVNGISLFEDFKYLIVNGFKLMLSTFLLSFVLPAV